MNSNNGMTRSRNDNNAVRTLFVSAFGLTPVALVSGMMVMQMLGLWTY